MSFFPRLKLEALTRDLVIGVYSLGNGIFNKFIKTTGDIEKWSGGVKVGEYIASISGNNVERIIAGDNMTIDNTDPSNPIISMENESGDVNSVNNELPDGAGNVSLTQDNIPDGVTNVQYSSSEKLDVANNTVHSSLTIGNPHNVYKSDVGLDKVDNTSDVSKPVSMAGQNAEDEITGKTVESSELLKRIDINGVYKWLFETSEVVTDNTRTVTTVKNEFGGIGMELQGTASIQNNTTDVYLATTPDVYTWRRPDDQILMGPSLQMLKNGDGAIAHGTEELLDITKEFSITTWFNATTVCGYIWGKASSVGAEKLGFWLEKNVVIAPGYYVGQTVAFRCYGGKVTIPELSADVYDYLNKVVCLTLVNYRDTDGVLKFKYFVNGVKGTVDLDAYRSTQPETKVPLALGARYNNDGTLTYSMVGSIGKIIVKEKAITDNEAVSHYWNPHMQYVQVGLGSSSMKGVTGLTDIDNGYLYRNDDARRANTITWNLGTSGTTFYTGAPDDYLIPDYLPKAADVRSGSPDLSLEGDRSIGNFAATDQITMAWLVPNPVMHKTDLNLRFNVNASELIGGEFVYSESMNSAVVTNYGLSADITDPTKMLIYGEDTSGILYNYVSTLPVFDGKSHTVRLFRKIQTVGATTTFLFLEVDGVIELVPANVSSEDFEPAQNSYVGSKNANEGGSIGTYFTGKVWDFQKQDELIPISDGSGVNIANSDGVNVAYIFGLSTPLFWNYFVSRVRPAPLYDLNITHAVARMGADIAHVWYPSNYTETSKAYSPYVGGSDFGTEYMQVVHAIEEEASTYDCSLIWITPTPIAGEANNGVVRGDLHKVAAVDMLDTGDRVMDAFEILGVDGSNTEQNPLYYFDGVNFNDAGHQALFVVSEGYSDLIYVGDKARRYIANKILVDNLNVTKNINGPAIVSLIRSLGLEEIRSELLKTITLYSKKTDSSNAVSGYNDSLEMLLPEAGLYRITYESKKTATATISCSSLQQIVIGASTVVASDSYITEANTPQDSGVTNVITDIIEIGVDDLQLRVYQQLYGVSVTNMKLIVEKLDNHIEQNW